MIRTALFKVLFISWFALWAPVAPLGIISGEIGLAIMRMIARGILVLARLVAGIRYEIHGEFIPGAIIASKHMSVLEGAIFCAHCPNMTAIIKRELMWIPVYGWMWRRMGLIPVNRSKGATNMKALAEAAARKIKSGRTLIIFPEGTRAKPGAGVVMRRGLLMIAAAAKVPIQPVGLDTGLFWPKRGRMRGGTAHVWLEPPMPYDASLEDIAAAIARHSV